MLIGWSVLGLGGVVWAQAGPSQQVQNGASPQPYWQQAKTLIRQGAYREALQPLDHLSTLLPDDPWVPLYRHLCQVRLSSTAPFAPLSPAELASLRTRLQQEAQAQRQTAVAQKVIERHLRQEQAQWDRTLALLKREAERIQQATQRQERAEEARRARAEGLARLARAPQPPLPPGPAAAAPPPPQAVSVVLHETKTWTIAPLTAASLVPPNTTVPGIVQGIQPSVPTEEPSAPLPPEHLMGAREVPSVELAPVVVVTGPSTAPREGLVSPSLVSRPAPPPGGVQINARQMHVAPDRNVAVAEGDVEAAFENAFLTCDRLTLFTDTYDVYAEGHVRLEQGAQVFRGDMVQYNLRTKKGRFLQGTVSAPPWHEHGRSIEHLAEGVYVVTPGYVTSCDLEPPHFSFYGRRAIVFADDKLARIGQATLVVEQLPFLYLPWLSVAERQSPFFIIPGKKKPWEEFVLMGYRYEWPEGHNGALRVDWRRAFGWGTGIDHKFDTRRLGKGLVKVYYNEEPNIRVPNPKTSLPKGAAQDRYRMLVRHQWTPLPQTSMVTNIQEFSDRDFRKDFLFRDEFVKDDSPESFISVVKSTPDFSLSGLLRKRMNRFETVDEALPQVTLDVRPQRLADTPVFSESKLDFANFQTKRAHSDNDTDVVRVDWFQQFKYALGLFRPIEVTPRAGVRQTYYTKDIQSGSTDRPQGKRDLISGQFSLGADASLKLFRIFPVTTDLLGLDIHWLRHIVTPTIAYSYVHPPTVPSALLTFAAAEGSMNQLTFSLENKLQTKRKSPQKPIKEPIDSQGALQAKTQGVDVARFILSSPYTFRGPANKQGGRLGDWSARLEMFPWSWLRLETGWSYPSHFLRGSRDERVTQWSLDLVMVGGRTDSQAYDASRPQTPQGRTYQPGPRGSLVALLMPQGQWYFGLGRRYSYNDKTEDAVQFDWRLSEQWEISTFHRFREKEVAGGVKRFNNVREYQYILRRDLHDWIAEVVYRVDREFGEELFFTLTLKAYPILPIELEESYHQPKLGSQSSPFSPVGRQ